jgi:hypothetical protein
MLIAAEATRVLLPAQQRFCTRNADRFFVNSPPMAGRREEIVKIGKRLAAERTRRTHRGKALSTTTLAELATRWIKERGLPVKKIHQQEISALENATLDKGPQRLVPWMMILMDFVEGGHLDKLLAASNETPGVTVTADQVQERVSVVRDQDGNVVGSIVWEPQAATQ